MLQNSFLIKMVMKRLDTIVPIIPLIRSLAKAKFCNVFGHPIIFADMPKFFSLLQWICRFGHMSLAAHQ
ncbi:hypothetical protein AAZX31_07G210600 [Glycine max]